MAVRAVGSVTKGNTKAWSRAACPASRRLRWPCNLVQSAARQPRPLAPLASRRSSKDSAPFEIPSSFRHSAAPSDSTILQDQRENHHTSLAGSIMMIADAALLKARAADVSCAQLGSATRARDTVRSPGRCSLNDMHLFSTPLYITRQAPPCVLPIIIFCHD